ncbi:50S ribosomal protein L22 [Candidatus Woesearchaeota archaeon]|nr:50S ribosomal protein L22 [Candidatus Woesearchaeota archaeon]MBT4114752.1 50S ribosomal protein L22 [Candidatus Woesearchaeota archaeon]MBT4248125.1 50S ribosomal protein L22 [Candidatus Woesearchaeota archaeon]
MARAKANYAPISMKTTYEVLRLIRGRNLDQAVTMLGEVKEAKRPVAFLKYRKDVPHRKGDGLSIGRFPRKVSIELIELLTLVKANAKEKGLKEDALIIIHAAVNSGPNLWHYGRIRRRRRKSCHVEVVVQEKEQKKKEVKKK